MKILFILDLYKPHIGGVEILFENLINRLVNKGHKIKVLTSKYDKDLPEYEKLENGVEIYRTGSSRYSFTFACLKKGFELAKRADIIHGTTYNSAIPASIIGKRTNKKVILTAHEIFGQLRYRFMGWKGFFFKAFEAFVFKFHYDKIICVSNYTKNCLRIHFGISDEKLITIYNGVDYERWNRKNFPQKEIDAVKEKYNLWKHYVGFFYGRPGISKGLIYYVKAIPEIIKSIPNFKAMLNVPESPNNKADDIRKFIKDNKLEKYIIRIPGVKYKELGSHILASDLVVIPSLVEGFGLAAAETCALSQQIVTSKVAALTEVVSGKVNFAEPANSHDIANKVIDFYNGKYQDIVRKEFLWNDHVEQVLDCYNTELGKNSK